MSMYPNPNTIDQDNYFAMNWYPRFYLMNLLLLDSLRVCLVKSSSCVDATPPLLPRWYCCCWFWPIASYLPQSMTHHWIDSFFLLDFVRLLTLNKPFKAMEAHSTHLNRKAKLRWRNRATYSRGRDRRRKSKPIMLWLYKLKEGTGIRRRREKRNAQFRSVSSVGRAQVS